MQVIRLQSETLYLLVDKSGQRYSRIYDNTFEIELQEFEVYQIGNDPLEKKEIVFLEHIHKK